MTQQQALALLHAGKSVLLTGAAGSGKTYVLQRFIADAKKQGKSVAVTATTGLAATHLNGTTIHAWSGIGVHDSVNRFMIQAMSKSRRDAIMVADVLVIDEISMLHDYRLDMVEQICREIRGGDRPFGGLQVVLCGDFFQLPPVNRSGSRAGGFVTNSLSWVSGTFTVCYLHESHRQKNDSHYNDLLMALRSNEFNEVHYERLQERMNARFMDDTLVSTKLHTTNLDVDTVNDRELRKLDSQARTYTMTTTGKKQYVEQLTKNCLAQPVLTLREGAVVMCIKNASDRKYVNGSLGVVVGFEGGTDYPIVKLNRGGRELVIKPDTWELVDGETKRASLSQIPLRLAWAITVHKSQGMTLDAAHIDLSRAFVEGMGYVALSRVRSLDTLSLLGLNAMALKVSREALAIEAALQQASAEAITLHTDVFQAYEQALAEEAAQPAKPAEKPVTTWAEKLEKMRKTHPKAYMPWTAADDKLLLSLWAEEKSITSLSKVLQRHEGSIKMRLKKLLGIEV